MSECSREEEDNEDQYDLQTDDGISFHTALDGQLSIDYDVSSSPMKQGAGALDFAESKASDQVDIDDEKSYSFFYYQSKNISL